MDGVFQKTLSLKLWAAELCEKIRFIRRSFWMRSYVISYIKYVNNISIFKNKIKLVLMDALVIGLLKKKNAEG